ncbi:MAG: LysM peptidoglycan-binding domain-containing protein [Pseudomonadota bacterium]
MNHINEGWGYTRLKFSLLGKVSMTNWLWCCLLSALVISSASAQSNPILASDYPERYTVVKGDTLWDISQRFLRDAWRWPEVWQGNPQVENPDLIYPGDVLVMTFIDGKPVLRSLRREVVKLSPKARAEDYIDAIPPIDPSAIQPYLNSPLVTDEKELEQAGYLVNGFDNRLLLGKYDQFYARGMEDQQAKTYRIFRPGRHFKDPITDESLGFEAVHIGDANMLKSGDPARLLISKSFEDATLRDRLRPVLSKEALPFFYPKAPLDVDVSGFILDTPNRSAELGAMSVVAISIGQRNRLEAGDVLRIYSQRVRKTDPVTGEKYFIPEEEVGLALVFRTFEKVSYALVTDSERQVLPGDRLRSPLWED